MSQPIGLLYFRDFKHPPDAPMSAIEASKIQTIVPRFDASDKVVGSKIELPNGGYFEVIEDVAVLQARYDGLVRLDRSKGL